MVAKRKARRRVELVYKLDGRISEVDVFKLAPALQGIGEIITAAHGQLQTEHDVAVNVKPFSKGSFNVDISLFIQSHLPIILLSAATVAEAMSRTTDILESLGLIKGKAESMISAIKKLRGAPKVVEAVGPNQYRYESEAGDVTVNGDVHTLMQNPTIHAAAMYVFAQPTRDDSITGIETFLRGREQETKVTIEKHDADAFESFSQHELPSPLPVEEKTVGPIDYPLKPKRISLAGESDNWSFLFGQGQTLRIDVIRDQKFLAQVKNGDRRLGADDLLMAKVIHVQKIRGTQIIGERNELLEVVEYREAPAHPPTQNNLFHKDDL